jgi:hypothetical protein
MRIASARSRMSQVGGAEVGDRVQVPSTKVGEAPRDGVVTGVTGSLLRVRWSTGEESTVVPSMGSLAVVGKQSDSVGQARRARAARKVAEVAEMRKRT